MSRATSAAPSVTVSGRTLAAGGGVVAALFMCVGAAAPWLQISVFGVSVTRGGLHSPLDGKWLLLLGLVGLAAAAALAVASSGTQLRQLAAAGLLLVAVVGLVFVVHQYVVISDKAGEFNTFLSDIGGGAVDVHMSSGWGLWLAGFGCAGAAAAAVLSFVL
jgi:hypothetical protein